MIDVSWGELLVLTGAGLILVGRKDLPVASRALGTQVGRIVGLLRGARLRADRFASDHQLKQLQNEFRAGLRELDAVKAEMAGSMMSTDRLGGGGMMGGGGNLGALVSGVDRRKRSMAEAAPDATRTSLSAPLPSSTAASSMGAEYLEAAQQAESSQGNSPSVAASDGGAARLAPRSQSVAAVAEEEWEKRGIGFRSIAEMGGAAQRHSPADGFAGPNSPPVAAGVGGAVILSNYLRQSLIYDQYERTVREQDDALRSRVEKVRKERSDDKS